MNVLPFAKPDVLVATLRLLFAIAVPLSPTYIRIPASVIVLRGPIHPTAISVTLLVRHVTDLPRPTV